MTCFLFPLAYVISHDFTAGKWNDEFNEYGWGADSKYVSFVRLIEWEWNTCVGLKFLKNTSEPCSYCSFLFLPAPRDIKNALLFNEGNDTEAYNLH